MLIDYDDNKNKMVELAKSYYTHCLEIDKLYDKYIEEAKQEYKEKQEKVYSVPKTQLSIDYIEMKKAVDTLCKSQGKYKTDKKLFSDILKKENPYEYKPSECIDFFKKCIEKANLASESLLKCKVEEEEEHFCIIAKSFLTIKEIYENIEDLLDEGYKASKLVESLKDEFLELEEDYHAEREAKKILQNMPQYEECIKISEALIKKSAEFNEQLLSIDKLDDSAFPEKILIGQMVCELDKQTIKFWTEKIGVDLDMLTITGCYFPIIKEYSSLIINAVEKDIKNSEFDDFLVCVFLQMIASFPTKYLRVCGLQGDLSGIVCSLVSELTSAVGEAVTFGGAKSTESSISDAVDEISELMEERIKFYGRKYTDIFDYNNRSQENAHPFVLLFINDYPKAFEERSVRLKIQNLIESGGRCGIIALLVNRTDANIERFGEIIPPLDTEVYGDVVIEYTGHQSFSYQNHDFDGIIYRNDFSEFDFWQKLAISTQKVSKPIMLDSIINQKYDRNPYYDEIKIPVGKMGNELQFFKLDVESTGKAAAIIAGGTGSGKTTFLHTLILSGAMNYSPEEIEFYLIDFKDGVEFSNYLNKEDEVSAFIPHVSFISLKNRVEDAYDVLHKIHTLKTKRNLLFNLAGATDFKTYHLSNKVKNGELPKLKRTIVIIDEYQNMLEPTGSGNAFLASKCSSMLLALLKEIRNAGISMILSSQAICVGREAKDQIFNRVIFNCSETTINSAFETSHSSEMMNALQQERGLAYMSEDGGVHTSLFKSAWAGKTNGTHHQATSKDICEKWSSISYEPMIISGNSKELYISSGNSILSNLKYKNLIEEKSSSYVSVIGQSFLSDEPVSIEFSISDFSSYVIVGELNKTRNIETSIALSFLLELKRNGEKLENTINYCEVNYTSEGRKHRSPLESMISKLNDIVIFNKTEIDVANCISNLYDIYQTRRNALKNGVEIDITPHLLIINSVHNILDFDFENQNDQKDDGKAELSDFDKLLMETETKFSSNKNVEDCIRQLALLYERGFEQHIFVVLSEREPNYLREVLPRTIRYEKAVYTSKNAMSMAEWSNSRESVSVEELAPNCCIVLPNVSKVRPYNFQNSEDWFEKFVDIIRK